MYIIVSLSLSLYLSPKKFDFQKSLIFFQNLLIFELAFLKV